MNELDHVAQILDHLRAMLEAELVQARGQRLLIRALDTQGLFERARQRSVFNAQLAQLERALGETLEAAGHTLGLSQVTLVDLRKAVPEASQRLVHHAEVVVIEGESYRLKEAKEQAELRGRQRRKGAP
jgi:hypothetical protein